MAENESNEGQMLSQWLASLGGSVRSADENGLFVSKQDERQTIYSELLKVQPAIDAKEFAKAQEALIRAEGSFNHLWNTARVPWRLCHHYGLVHHVACALSGAGAAFLILFSATLFEDFVPVFICMVAIMGAVLRALFYLSFQANRRVLRAVWITRCFSGPFIAIFLGVGLYLAMKAGLILISDEGVDAEPNKYALGFAALCAGLFWEEAMEKLRGAFARVKAKQ